MHGVIAIGDTFQYWASIGLLSFARAREDLLLHKHGWCECLGWLRAAAMIARLASFGGRCCVSGRRALHTPPTEPSWSLRSLGVDLDGSEPRDRPHLLTRDKLEYLAELSQLDVSSGALDSEQLLSDVDGIMQCVRCVQGVSLPQSTGAVHEDDHAADGQAVAAGGARVAPLRADVVMEGNDPEAILSNAKSREGDFFVVPQVLDGAEQPT